MCLLDGLCCILAECHAQTEPVLSMQPVLGSALDPQQQVNASGQELQSLLDVGSLLKLHPGTGDQMKDEREGESGGTGGGGQVVEEEDGEG